MAVEALPIGPLQRRASRIISNGSLYDLVQDMAAKLDVIAPRMDTMDNKLDTILELLRGKI